MTHPARQGLPVRVQFTLNPILHRDAITLLQGLSKSDLAETVAGLLQLGALVQNSMHQGQFSFMTNFAQIQSAVSPAGQPAANIAPAPAQANVHQLPAPRMTKDMLAGAFDFSGVRQ